MLIWRMYHYISSYTGVSKIIRQHYLYPELPTLLFSDYHYFRIEKLSLFNVENLRFNNIKFSIRKLVVVENMESWKLCHY